MNLWHLNLLPPQAMMTSLWRLAVESSPDKDESSFCWPDLKKKVVEKSRVRFYCIFCCCCGCSAYYFFLNKVYSFNTFPVLVGKKESLIIFILAT